MKIVTHTKEDRYKFKTGEEYYTFFMETTRKGNALRNIVPVFKTHLVERVPSQYQICGNLLYFYIPDTLKISGTMKQSLPAYMNGYGCARCTFYTSYEEAVEAFDEMVEELARYVKASDRDAMRKKKYNQKQIEVEGIESEAKKWKSKLTETEVSYLNWFIENT